MRVMRALTELPLEARRATRVVLADIDDTITTDGLLTSGVFAAMERLQSAGLKVVPITGRPAGWCDHIARMWPVDAVVGENGAFYFCYDRQLRRMHRRYVDDEQTRTANRGRLAGIARLIVDAVPGAAVAADQHYRETDLAIDFCEDVPRLPQASVDRIVALMEQQGLTAKVSSIHVNGWFGAYDKLAMTRLLMRERFDTDVDRQRESFVFVGDSPNDAPMFAHFPHAVGVANVRDFESRIPHPPAFVSTQRSGAGFCEVADCVLSATSARNRKEPQ